MIHPGMLGCLALGVGAVGAAVAGPTVPVDGAPALPLAREATPGLSPQGWLVSEKYDGVRAVWDGRRLRTRAGLPIAAPAWFLAGLPALALDGELWLGRQRFDEVSALVRRGDPDEPLWRELRYLVFESAGLPGDFEARVRALQALSQANGASTVWQPAPQQRLADPAALARRLDEVVAGGGEGLVLHRADAPYVVGRSELLLKLKPVQDDEAVVVGHLPGQGKYQGRLGALRVRDAQGRVFSIGSGLSDAQRLSPPPLGSTVSYRWRGRTATGLPRFATLWRLREPGL